MMWYLQLIIEQLALWPVILTSIRVTLAALAVWVQTPDGSNALAAAICMAALCGATSRVCLIATLILHLLLIIT